MRRFVAIAVPGAMLSAAALGAFAAYRVARPLYRTWGAEPGEADRLLPGDQLIASPTASETRSILIKAPAPAVWPWLVQMGYGRAGWYSYRPLDMAGASADTIVPGLQSIAVGDTMPISAEGGFNVVEIRPDQTLVLYVDDVIAEHQRQAAAEGPGTLEAAPAERSRTGRLNPAAIGRTRPSMFRATWSFVLEPVDGGSTRLVERVRVQYAPMGPLPRVTRTFLGFGLFVMMRRQLLGLQERAERLIGKDSSRPPEVAGPVKVGPHQVVAA